MTLLFDRMGRLGAGWAAGICMGCCLLAGNLSAEDAKPPKTEPAPVVSAHPGLPPVLREKVNRRVRSFEHTFEQLIRKSLTQWDDKFWAKHDPRSKALAAKFDTLIDRLEATVDKESFKTRVTVALRQELIRSPEIKAMLNELAAEVSPMVSKELSTMAHHLGEDDLKLPHASEVKIKLSALFAEIPVDAFVESSYAGMTDAVAKETEYTIWDFRKEIRTAILIAVTAGISGDEAIVEKGLDTLMKKGAEEFVKQYTSQYLGSLLAERAVEIFFLQKVFDEIEGKVLTPEQMRRALPAEKRIHEVLKAALTDLNEKIKNGDEGIQSKLRIYFRGLAYSVREQLEDKYFKLHVKKKEPK